MALTRGKPLLHQGKKLNLGEVGELSGDRLGIDNMLGRKPTVSVLHCPVELLGLVTNVGVQQPFRRKVRGCCLLILESDF
jgi:hypothetical protein